MHRGIHLRWQHVRQAGGSVNDSVHIKEVCPSNSLHLELRPGVSICAHTLSGVHNNDLRVFTVINHAPSVVDLWIPLLMSIPPAAFNRQRHAIGRVGSGMFSVTRGA